MSVRYVTAVADAIGAAAEVSLMGLDFAGLIYQRDNNTLYALDPDGAGFVAIGSGIPTPGVAGVAQASKLVQLGASREIATLGPITADGLLTVGVTLASATPGTLESIKGTTTTHSAVTAGTLDGVRGAVIVPGGAAISGGTFLYGVTGRLTVGAAATVDVGSSQVFAGFFKADFSTTSTITAGHVGAVAANIVNPPAAGTKIDLFYGESASGNVINSYFKAFGKTTYCFDFESNVFNQMSTTGTAGATATKGWLKVLVEGVVRYIPLTDAVS